MLPADSFTFLFSFCTSSLFGGALILYMYFFAFSPSLFLASSIFNLICFLRSCERSYETLIEAIDLSAALNFLKFLKSKSRSSLEGNTIFSGLELTRSAVVPSLSFDVFFAPSLIAFVGLRSPIPSTSSVSFLKNLLSSPALAMAFDLSLSGTR